MEKQFKINGNTYLYDIKRMSARRILQAVTLFKLHQKMEMNMPSTVEELKMLVAKEAEANAYGAMLMKVELNEDGSIKSTAKYDPFRIDGVDILNDIEGLEALTELMECRADFFQNTGLGLTESLAQLPDLMNQLNLIKDKETLNQLLQAAVNLRASSEKESKHPKSTKITKTNSENL